MNSRAFAIIPAAGHSRRMGQHKLLLPWMDDKTSQGESGTVMDHVLQAWTTSRVDKVVVVLRSGDVELLKICQSWAVTTVCPPDDPPDMKASIQHGLHHLANEDQPNERDRWLVAPADLPQLNAELINAVVKRGLTNNNIVAPRFGARQGHPVSLPWTMSKEVFDLQPDEGINRILDRHPIDFVELPAEARLKDVDTWEEYIRLQTQARRADD